MKSLLIIGAGGHGHVVKDIAEACGYDSIDFLDDKAPEAVGKLNEVLNLATNYSGVFVAIGNNSLRQDITEKIEHFEGVNIITLVHPSAYVSPSAFIGKGTVIEPNAIVNTNCSIGSGCIISVGSIVDHDSIIGCFSHINAGAICMSGSKIDALVKVNAGEILTGF